MNLELNILFYFRVGELYEYALLPEHNSPKTDMTVDKTTITDTGALSVTSGLKTGRVPRAKRIVYDVSTRDSIWWGDINMPMDP